jgi:hypothetical protein
VFSNSEFNVHSENQNEADKGYDLIRFRTNKTDATTNEYVIGLTVPREITHDFKSNLVLTHATTKLRTVLPITFSSTGGHGT